MPKQAEAEKIATEPVETFVPDPQVARELGVTLMTLWRYDGDDRMAKLGWPPKIRMRNRNFRSRRLFEKFKNAALRRAIAERGSAP